MCIHENKAIKLRINQIELLFIKTCFLKILTKICFDQNHFFVPMTPCTFIMHIHEKCILYVGFVIFRVINHSLGNFEHIVIFRFSQKCCKDEEVFSWSLCWKKCKNIYYLVPTFKNVFLIKAGYLRMFPNRLSEFVRFLAHEKFNS